MQADTIHRRANGIRRRASGIAATLLFGVVLGPQAYAETLDEALAKAYGGNPTLQAARAELRATDEQVAQALSGWRPTLSAGASVGRVWEDTSTALTSSNTERRLEKRADVTVSQPIYRGGRTVAATSQAENLVRSQRATLSSVEQGVLLDVVTAYTNVVRDEAVLQLNVNNEQVLQRQLEAARDRFDVGEITLTDVAQAESRLSLATADRIEAEGNLTSSRAVYREIIGDFPAELVPPMVPGGLPASQSETVAGAVNNPSLIAAQFAERAALDSKDAVYGELLPSVSLDGQLAKLRDVGRDGNETESASVTARVTVPLYQAGGVESRVREAKQTIAQRRQQIEEERRSAEQFAISAWQALETAKAQIASFEAQVRAAQIALDGVRQENLVGARTVLDVLDAEQEQLDAQVNLVQSRRDEVVAAYQVLAAVGRLTAPTLGLPVQYYDVEAYYRYARDKWWGIGPPVE